MANAETGRNSMSRRDCTSNFVKERQIGVGLPKVWMVAHAFGCGSPIQSSFIREQSVSLAPVWIAERGWVAYSRCGRGRVAATPTTPRLRSSSALVRVRGSRSKGVRLEGCSGVRWAVGSRWFGEVRALKGVGGDGVPLGLVAEACCAAYPSDEHRERSPGDGDRRDGDHCFMRVWLIMFVYGAVGAAVVCLGRLKS
jgi:hypothetical protein